MNKERENSKWEKVDPANSKREPKKRQDTEPKTGNFTKRESEKEALEAQLEAQQEAESMMLHDLKNPVTSILSIAEMLRHRDLPEEDLRWIDKIKSLGEKTLLLMKTASGFNKMQRGDYTLESSTFDLVKVVNEVLHELSPIARARNVQPLLLYQGAEIDLSGAGAIPEIRMRADQLYIKQLLSNLLTNALEAAPKESQVTLTIMSQSPLHMDIHNRGAIPLQIRDKIFQKYTTEGKRKGKGLGIYLSKLIAEQHQGSISFVSSEEEGTRFTVIIPDQET